MASAELLDIILSVDSDEWYYGRRDHRQDSSKRVLVKGLIPENVVVASKYAREINEYFLWTKEHERDTAKKKKRLFYIDRSFFINPNVVL